LGVFILLQHLYKKHTPLVKNQAVAIEESGELSHYTSSSEAVKTNFTPSGLA
jgi:hypothetical protein